MILIVFLAKLLFRFKKQDTTNGAPNDLCFQCVYRRSSEIAKQVIERRRKLFACEESRSGFLEFLPLHICRKICEGIRREEIQSDAARLNVSTFGCRADWHREIISGRTELISYFLLTTVG